MSTENDPAGMSRRQLIRHGAWFGAAVVLTVASYAAFGLLVSWRTAVAIAALVAACILCVSAFRMWQFREGGHAVADLLGASLLDTGRCVGNERRLLNVVEEMSIASGVAVWCAVSVIAHRRTGARARTGCTRRSATRRGRTRRADGL